MGIFDTKAKWPTLARDMAMLDAPGSPITERDVSDAHGVSSEEMNELRQTAGFKSMLARETENVEREGDRAVTKYRALTMSNALLEQLFVDATSGTMEPKDAIKLLETMLRASGIMEPERAVAQVNTQVNLALPNIPKLAHVIGGNE